ncbi:MAG: ATP-binding protein, partial [Gammaproteobacteria bacterium]|nr:ATP-binding protein [Gammaproteobacteria bacterium]
MSKISHYHDHAEDLALEEQTNYYPKSLFSEGVPFYNDGERLELFKKIAHLVEFTDLILFVKGPPSSGKTKLIQNRFVFEAKSNWRPVILDASIHKTSEQVLAEMSKKLDLPRFTPQLKDSANSFVEQLDEYRSNGFLVVLVVDNAQNLKKEVVELLVQLAKPNNDASPLSSLILFGEHPPTSLLKEVNVKSSSEPYKEMQIPLMNEVDLNHYIDDILNDIGHFSNQPFTPRCRQKIVEKSKGQIKTINSLIDKEWRRYSNSQNKTERKKSRLPG